MVEYCRFYIVDQKTEAQVTVVGAYWAGAVVLTLMGRWCQHINVRCFSLIRGVSSTVCHTPGCWNPVAPAARRQAGQTLTSTEVGGGFPTLYHHSLFPDEAPVLPVGGGWLSALDKLFFPSCELHVLPVVLTSRQPTPHVTAHTAPYRGLVMAVMRTGSPPPPPTQGPSTNLRPPGGGCADAGRRPRGTGIPLSLLQSGHVIRDDLRPSHPMPHHLPSADDRQEVAAARQPPLPVPSFTAAAERVCPRPHRRADVPVCDAATRAPACCAPGAAWPCGGPFPCSWHGQSGAWVWGVD